MVDFLKVERASTCHGVAAYTRGIRPVKYFCSTCNVELDSGDLSPRKKVNANGVAGVQELGNLQAMKVDY